MAVTTFTIVLSGGRHCRPLLKKKTLYVDNIIARTRAYEQGRRLNVQAV